MKALPRKGVLSITPYVAGKPIEETKREFGLKEVFKLASNENPLGPSPKAVAAVKKALLGVNRYPDSQGFCLKKSLAEFWGLKPENFTLGNGSDEIIDLIIRTFAEADENILTSEGTFLEYGIIAQANQRRIKKTPLRDFKYDLDAMLGSIDPKTKIIFLANPNNPTGTYLNKNQITRFISLLPEGVITVLDEAYDAFIDVEDYPDSLSTLKDNVIVLKTFSKAYGLAGLRLGYAVSSAETISYLERVRQPFNVNLLAQEAGAAALKDKKFLTKTRKVILEGKDFLPRSFRRGN
jgi:histidinol-phosphate aminotransferase